MARRLASTTGAFQMLKVVGAPGYEAAIGQIVGVPLPVECVNITHPDPVPVSQVVGGVTLSSVFAEGLAAGGELSCAQPPHRSAATAA